MKALRFLQALALVPATLPACGPATPAQSPSQSPAGATSPSASASASSSGVAANPPPSSTTTIADGEPPPDPTAGSGPCRCSWETNAAAAPRVCKKGEANHTGKVCNPGKHYPYSGPIKGPLDPPELAPAV